MNISHLRNGQAYLCTNQVLYPTGSPDKIGTVSFTEGKLYYISQNCYLIDDNGITKNWSWYEENFTRSPEHDVVPVKKNTKKKQEA